MSDMVKFDEGERDVIRQMFFGREKPTQAEERALFAVAQARGLNPIRGECYFVQRKGKWAVQTSIDAFRSMAEQSGDYAGQGEPEFEYDGGGRLVACRIKVYRKSVPDRPFAIGYARLDEYVQLIEDYKTKQVRPAAMWMKPHIMLSKCCEAVALRKAFPQQLMGVYTSDEMAQADNPEPRTEAYAKGTVHEVISPEPPAKALPQVSGAQVLAAFAQASTVQQLKATAKLAKQAVAGDGALREPLGQAYQKRLDELLNPEMPDGNIDASYEEGQQ